MIFVLPGMGADQRMYPGPWRHLPDTVFVDWPEHRGEDSIPAVAIRIIAEQGIKDGDVVVGSSLGGMVGCEISKRVRLRGLVLIGSATGPTEIPRLFSTLVPLVDWLPLGLLLPAIGKLPYAFARMFGTSQPSFIRAMCHAIFAWDGSAESRTKTVRIHGARDQLIPLPAHVDLVLAGAHMIAMTHPQECVDFILKEFPSPPG